MKTEPKACRSLIILISFGIIGRTKAQAYRSVRHSLGLKAVTQSAMECGLQTVQVCYFWLFPLAQKLFLNANF